ncbi:unnamed protein product [Bathycoccus prasinos]
MADQSRDDHLANPMAMMMMARPDANNTTTAAAGTNNDINLVRPTASNTTTYANAAPYGGQMPGPNNYFGNPFFISQMWNNAAAMMNMNAAAAAAAGTGNFPAMMGAMPQQLQGQPQPTTAAAATGAAKKNSKTRLRDMTKQAKSRSDNSEATKEEVEEQDAKDHQPQLAKPVVDDSLPEPCANKTCAFCRTQKTPLWRNGPFGPKTLCNACGVKFKLGKLAGDEDGHVVSVIVPRQKRRKNGSAGTASHAAATAAAQNAATSSEAVGASNTATAMTSSNNATASATARFAAVTAANAARAGFSNAPLKVRHTVHTKKSVEPKVRGIVGGWRPEMGGPMRVSSPFVVADYDGAVLLMVLAGENDKNTTATAATTTTTVSNT